jgi:hypothetical protein
MIEQLKKADSAIMANGVWVCFEKKPTLIDIREARRLLDQLTDELIKEKFNAEGEKK